MARLRIFLFVMNPVNCALLVAQLYSELISLSRVSAGAAAAVAAAALALPRAPNGRAGLRPDGIRPECVPGPASDDRQRVHAAAGVDQAPLAN